MIRPLLLAVTATAALATSLAAQDPRALQVSAQGGFVSTFTLADLDALEQVTITTTTIWTEGEVTFTGPSLSDVLEAAGSSGDVLTLTALNDYAIEMPAPAEGDPFPIVATRLDGAPMSVRDKGPFWIVFPYDSDPAFQTETIYAQSIWQLDRIEALD
ncbi:putative pterin-binding protein [Gymnodinialimonas sp.]